MKKITTLVLTMLMMLSFSTVAFAEEAPAAHKGEYAAIKAEIQMLRDELLDLREEHKGIHAQAVEKRENIKSALKAAKEADEVDKIKAVKALKEEIKALHQEIQSIKDDKHAVWGEIKTAKTQKDFEAVKANLAQVIELKKQLIEKATSRLDLLDDILDSLK